MEAPESFSLSLTPVDMEAQCAALAQQFRSPAQVLSALVALQSLFASAPPGQRENAPYREIQAVISDHAERARAQLLAECQSRLQAALQRRDTPEVTRVHGALSRNGFWQAAAEAARRRGNADLQGDLAWLNEWCAAARSRAEAASPYPDALDFRAAGIAPEEFAAMDELLRCARSL